MTLPSIKTQFSKFEKDNWLNDEGRSKVMVALIGQGPVNSRQTPESHEFRTLKTVADGFVAVAAEEDEAVELAAGVEEVAEEDVLGSAVVMVVAGEV